MSIDPRLYETARARQDERLERSLAAYGVRAPRVHEHGVRHRTLRLLGRLLGHQGNAAHAPVGTRP
jgi:hypothetical protein